jgi:hypothetical protein
MPQQKPTLIAYYAGGWHYGYLVRRGYKWTRIRRILAIGAHPKKRGIRAKFVTVATADTQAVVEN